MNILAHLVLSGDSEDIRFGNFIGDAVKGKDYLTWDHEIQVGLRLHRFIDSYTDEHEDALIVRRILATKLGLYAPIALDIIFDHCLSLLWNEFYSMDRKGFIHHCYLELEKRRKLMPGDIEFMFSYMQSQDWLMAYATETGIRRALKGLSVRVRGNPELEIAFDIFEANRNKVILHFRKFFIDLMALCDRKRLELLRIDG